MSLKKIFTSLWITVCSYRRWKTWGSGWIYSLSTVKKDFWSLRPNPVQVFQNLQRRSGFRGIEGTKLVLNRSIYVGFSLLDISKKLMYDFHYSFMKGLAHEQCYCSRTQTLCAMRYSLQIYMMIWPTTRNCSSLVNTQSHIRFSGSQTKKWSARWRMKRHPPQSRHFSASRRKCTAWLTATMKKEQRRVYAKPLSNLNCVTRCTESVFLTNRHRWSLWICLEQTGTTFIQ